MAEVDEIRMNVAIASRILGMVGLLIGTTGHVSARIPGTEEMWIRCRGGDEKGNLFTGLHNVRRVDFDGKGPGVDETHASPIETPIHGEVYRARPDVMAVVHAHPPYALLVGITDVPYRPVFGAYDPSGLQMVQEGVPIFPKSLLISNRELGGEMVGALGQRDIMLMRGHGTVVTSHSVQTVTVKAMRFDRLSQVMWELATSGLKIRELPAEEQQAFGRQRQPGQVRTGWQALPGVENWEWNMYVQQLIASGIGLPDDAG